MDDVQLVVAPPGLERRRRRPAPARRARRARRRRGRGGRRGRRRAGCASGAYVAAWAIASSVSVAALSTGWRTTSVCSDAHARPSAEIESRSPTSTVGSSPAARAWSRPPSAAMSTASRGIAATARRSSGAAPVMTTTSSSLLHVSLPPPALPGSGSRVGGGSRPLSPLDPVSSPCWSGTTVAARCWARRWLTIVNAARPTMTRTIPGTWAGRIASPRMRKLQHTASAGWATWMMPIVATSTSRWAKAISPWPSIPVSTDSRATAIQPLADSGQISSPARTRATGRGGEHADRHHRRHEVDDVDGGPGPAPGEQVADPRADDDDHEGVAADASPRPGCRRGTAPWPGRRARSAPTAGPAGRAARGRARRRAARARAG